MLPRAARSSVFAAALVLAASCGADPPGVRPPSREDAGPTAAPSDAIPGVHRSDLARGAAQVEVTGDADAVLSLALAPPATYRPPDGALLLNWSDSGGNVLGIGGRVFVGDRTTGPEVTLTLAVPGSGIYASSRGECTVRIERADEGGLEGSFGCRGISGGAGRSADAEGTFSGSTS